MFLVGRLVGQSGDGSGRFARMDGFPMSPQIDFPLESFVAQATSERFVAGVLPRMRDQIGTLAERFTTHYAFMRLLTCSTKKRNKFLILYSYRNILLME